MPNANNVTTGKPQVLGGIFWAPKGTPLPTDATSVLDAAFVNLGYVSDAGLSNTNNSDSNEVRDWGGTTVLTTEEDYTDEYTFTLIEAKNVETLKFVFGVDNVSGDLQTGITVKANNKPKPHGSLVIDMAYSDGTIKRDVIPDGKLKERGDVEYTAGDPVGYESTVACYLDQEGNSHYEYMIAGPQPYISE